ncbi:serine/threonine protein kinase [Actinomadura graeca]|uniref:non-specific serine/threonine protein kinase n=1 Tax=Actinomadura graeca TaxID=2750812 RepID=A0ABX8QVW3_9ACTN|nr:serine/threonine-protein kinase [Actinomadura graeca]QXJ22906.1 serine/threonine protein kinase [Actinomadura graeca]
MSAGLVLDHRYRLLERLATGGMGEVWRASDSSAGRQVAVKLLRPEFGSDESARRRFGSEADLAAGLQHRGIAQVFDFGEQDGRMYLVMELVPGEALDAILARGGLPLEAVLDLMVQAGRALTVAHEAGIVHRDVKPANLMVSPDGMLKITDFGIARRLASASQTATGMVMGTAHYISPEQASGQPISPAADVYSLGVVAYECLTGAPPFGGRTPVEIALKHVKDAPPELPARVPAAARELISRMLAKAPEDRPADANAVADRALEIRARLRTGRPARSAHGPGIAASADAVEGPVAGPAAGASAWASASAAAGNAVAGAGVTRPAGGQTVRKQGRSSELSGFDVRSGPDNLTRGTGQRRSALAYASVAAGLLVAGVLAASLWKGFAFAGPGGKRDPAPVPATGPAGGEVEEEPAVLRGTPSVRKMPRPAPAVPRRHGTRSIRPSTPGTGRASTTQKPTRKPSRATPSAPGPTPRTMASTTTPSTPSPDPSPTHNGELGSEDKV